MSSFPGLGNKADKNKGKYTTININNIFKGKSVEQQKTPGKGFEKVVPINSVIVTYNI